MDLVQVPGAFYVPLETHSEERFSTVAHFKLTQWYYIFPKFKNHLQSQGGVSEKVGHVFCSIVD